MPGMETVDSTLDLTGARLRDVPDPGQGRKMQPAPSIELPNQAAECVSHIAVDIGGSLIKLVYFSQDASSDDEELPSRPSTSQGSLSNLQSQDSSSVEAGSARGGRLHFVKFETSRVEDAIAFIEAKGLLRVSRNGSPAVMRIAATGGGAFRYQDLFRDRLGVELEKEDEMACLVAGCNFLLKAIMHEAFTYENGSAQFTMTNEEQDLYPYLLVNIGSGVSMVRVTSDKQYERVSGSSLGGGTFWGLCHLLTGLQNFDDMLELSMQGNNANVDMLVGDIYGGRDYSNIGLSANTIASSFGKVISQDKSLKDYNPPDICMALCRMVSYNIGQLAYLNAMRYGIKRIFFGGFFIRGHPYTMETISYAIRFWSKGDMAAMFLRHEGFLGAVGAFLKVQPTAPGPSSLSAATSYSQPSQVRARFVERFSIGAPLTGGSVVGPAIEDLQGKVSWVEKFTLHTPSPVGDNETGTVGTASPTARIAADFAAAAAAAAAAAPAGPPGGTAGASEGASSLRRVNTARESDLPPVASHRFQSQVQRTYTSDLQSQIQRTYTHDQPVSPALRMALHVGVLHYSPGYEVFPLVDPNTYEPNTIFPLNDDESRWWINLLENQISTTVAKAAASEGNSEEAQRRAAAFGKALGAHMEKLRGEPGAYGALGLADLFELREECLREFKFHDVYKADKQRENLAALQVFNDLLQELDSLPAGEVRWLSLIEGALAANIFDWGANACVALYKAGTILDIYREARSRLSRRPWAHDTFDALMQHLPPWRDPSTPYRRVMMFVDNAGADIVLGQLPIARELLRSGTDVVMVANRLPAINDITANELEKLLDQAAEKCDVIAQARTAGKQWQRMHGGRVPHAPAGAQRAGSGGSGGDLSAHAVGSGRLFVLDNGQGSPCINFRRVPHVLAEAAAGTDLVIIEGMGRAIHTNFKAMFKCDSLLLAMIKTERLAKLLFGESGSLYDCVCKFTRGTQQSQT